MVIVAMPRQYTEENIRNEPNAPGLYELLDESEDTIYIGAGTMRDELLERLPSKSDHIMGASYYRIETANTVEQAVWRQREELNMYMEMYGRLPAFNQKISA